MQFATSRQYRRLVGRLSKGESVISSFERLCKREGIRAGSIQATGLLSHIQLQSYDPQGTYQSSVDADGAFELLTLTGNISTLGGQTIINCNVYLGTTHLGQRQTLGGTLVEATARTLEFIVVAYDDLVLERLFDPNLGIPVLNRVETVSGESATERSVPRVADPTPTRPEPQPAPKAAEPSAAAPDDDAAPASQADAEPAPTAAKQAPSAGARAAAFSSDGAATSRTSTPEIVRRPTPGRGTEVIEANPGAKTATAVGPSWSDVVDFSSRKKDEKRLGVNKPPRNEKKRSEINRAIVEEWDDVPDLKVGDLIKHPHFGLCRIMYVEEDDFIRVRMRGGKTVDIKLEVCDFKRIDDRDDKRVFNCTINVRR